MSPRHLLAQLALVVGLAGAGRARAERFAVYGDTRDDEAQHALVVAGLVKARPALALFTGDTVMHGDNEAEWARFLELEAPVNQAGIRVYAVRGNHDVGDIFPKHFKLPPEGAQGVDGAFSFDALGLHFLGLDTESNWAVGSPQHEFAKRDLEAHTGQAPIVVFLHRALYSSGKHGNDAGLQAAYGPLFEKAHVAVVFQGHDHDYERSAPINGVTYIVEGGGGAKLRDFEGAAPAWSRFRLSAFSYAVVDVTTGQLDIQAYDTGHTPIDRVTIATALPEPRHAVEPEPAPRPAQGIDPLYSVGGLALVILALGGLALTRLGQGAGPHA